MGGNELDEKYRDLLHKPYTPEELKTGINNIPACSPYWMWSRAVATFKQQADQIKNLEERLSILEPATSPTAKPHLRP